MSALQTLTWFVFFVIARYVGAMAWWLFAHAVGLFQTVAAPYVLPLITFVLGQVCFVLSGLCCLYVVATLFGFELPFPP